MDIFKNSFLIFHFFQQNQRITENRCESGYFVNKRELKTMFIGTPKEFFPRGNFPNVQFPSGNFPSLSQPQRSAPSPFQAWCSAPQPILAAAIGHLYSLRRLSVPNLAFGKLPLGKLHIWEIFSWEVVHGKMSFGKYLTPLKLSTTTVSLRVEF